MPYHYRWYPFADPALAIYLIGYSWIKDTPMRLPVIDSNPAFDDPYGPDTT